MKTYHYKAEEYWDSVARRLKGRKENSLIAGDDDPYYLYKRERFLRLLNNLSFQNKRVLEIGCGPGGNLVEVSRQGPLKLVGVDISNEMVALSRALLMDKAEVIRIDGAHLPFETNGFDVVFTSTVLQHITDESVLADLAREICRVCETDVYIFERIERKRKAIVSNVGRTKEEYISIFRENDFTLAEIKFIGLHWSWLACGLIRRIFNTANRREGAKQTSLARSLQLIALVVTKPLDKLLLVKRDLAMLHFKRSSDK